MTDYHQLITGYMLKWNIRIYSTKVNLWDNSAKSWNSHYKKNKKYIFTPGSYIHSPICLGCSAVCGVCMSNYECVGWFCVYHRWKRLEQTFKSIKCSNVIDYNLVWPKIKLQYSTQKWILEISMHPKKYLCCTKGLNDVCYVETLWFQVSRERTELFWQTKRKTRLCILLLCSPIMLDTVGSILS